jgi:DNA-3-methyladenine glycosylase
LRGNCAQARLYAACRLASRGGRPRSLGFQRPLQPSVARIRRFRNHPPGHQHRAIMHTASPGHRPASLVPLAETFFVRPTLQVARELVGMLLVHKHEGERLVGWVVETEAYTQDDPACHGWGAVDRVTGEIRSERRGAALYGAPGTAYVYLNYGMYWLLNVVTEPEGIGGAVLIRGVEPVEGIERMRRLRPAARTKHELTNGPGKLAQAFGVGSRHHGLPLTSPPLFFALAPRPHTWRVEVSSRIGISRGVELPWRFFVAENPYVSRGVPSNQTPPRRRRPRVG